MKRHNNEVLETAFSIITQPQFRENIFVLILILKCNRQACRYKLKVDCIFNKHMKLKLNAFFYKQLQVTFSRYGSDQNVKTFHGVLQP
jgi:hypothetical protein